MATFCGGLVVVLAVAVFVGWWLDVAPLRGLVPSAPRTTPLTAAMLLAVAAALLLARGSLREQAGQGWFWGCRLVALAAVLTALWVQLQYAFGLGPGPELALDRLFSDLHDQPPPGRPAPHTAVGTFLVGAAIGLSCESWLRVERVVTTLALLGMAIPWLALFGYAGAVDGLYALPEAPETGLSPLTAIGLLALGAGALGLRPREGPMVLITAGSPGGRLVRWFLPAVLLTPLLLGRLVVSWRDLGQVDRVTAFALSWGLTSLLLAGLVLWFGTLIHRFDAQAARQAEALERTNIDLQQFAYIASHDLQSPLRSISGFLQLLDEKYRGRLGEEADDWIERTIDSTRLMQERIRDALAYARADWHARASEPIPLNEVFGEAVESLSAAIADAGATVTRDELPTVVGDRSQLVQLLQNLVGNAVKYRGAEPARVHVSAVRQRRAWVVAVRDNGIGIEPRFQQKVFELFRRLHSQREYPGTGLGLAICRRVVERHGGRIWLQSQPAKGSTFYFSLPTED